MSKYLAKHRPFEVCYLLFFPLTSVHLKFSEKFINHTMNQASVALILSTNVYQTIQVRKKSWWERERERERKRERERERKREREREKERDLRNQLPNLHRWHQTVWQKWKRIGNPLIQSVRIYTQYIGMEFGIEKFTMLIIKSEKR